MSRFCNGKALKFRAFLNSDFVWRWMIDVVFVFVFFFVVTDCKWMIVWC